MNNRMSSRETRTERNAKGHASKVTYAYGVDRHAVALICCTIAFAPFPVSLWIVLFLRRPQSGAKHEASHEQFAAIFRAHGKWIGNYNASIMQGGTRPYLRQTHDCFSESRNAAQESSRFLYRKKKKNGEKKEGNNEKELKSYSAHWNSFAAAFRPRSSLSSASLARLCACAHTDVRSIRGTTRHEHTRRGIRTRIHAREHAHSVIALYCALRRLGLESDQGSS